MATEKINKVLAHLNEQHHGIKGTNLYGSEISLRESRGSSKEHKQTFKTWMGNQTGNTDKKAPTSKNTTTDEKCQNMSRRKEQSNKTRTKDATRKDKSKRMDKKKRMIKNDTEIE